MEQAHTDSHPGPGRPRGFDIDAALAAGIEVIRARGFEATSLDALTTAMGISRSSFYAAFGSKHGVLLSALRRTSRQRLDQLAAIAGQAQGNAAREMLRALAGSGTGPGECLMVNCISELSPHDPEVAALSGQHLDRVEGLFAEALSPSDPAAALDRARTLVAIALGVHALRKAGRAPEELAAILRQSQSLIQPST